MTSGTGAAPHIVVQGAGIGGIKTAVDLAESGCFVYLVESAPAIGGLLASLDYQFPDTHCGMCRMLPMVDRDAAGHFCLRRGLEHERISILTSTRVLSVEGAPGDASVTVERMPTGVDPDRCVGCGTCEAACSVEIPDRFNGGLVMQKAIHLPRPQINPPTRVIQWDACNRCGECATVCPQKAVDIDQEPETIQLENISAVVAAHGTAMFDPSASKFYGFGDLPNVVTARTFERILSSCGPYQASPQRPSGDSRMKKLAWVQCVGSRNAMTHATHCSGSCCMFAVKEAVLAKKKLGPDVETTIFYMDMRTFGRDHQRYVDDAVNNRGVRLMRCRVHSIEPGREPHELAISYALPGQPAAEEYFDLAVLSTGSAPAQEEMHWMQRPDVFSLREDCTLPDIGETTVRAAALAGNVLQNISKAKPIDWKDLRKTAEAPLRDSLKNAPAFAVIILCRDETQLPGYTIESVREAIADLPGSIEIFVDESLHDLASSSAINKLMDTEGVNRLVFVALNPVSRWPRLHLISEQTGIPEIFIETVEPDISRYTASRTFGDLDAVTSAVESAMNRLRAKRHRQILSSSVLSSALVVGAGPAGLRASSILAELGVDVTLVEKTGRLGGNDIHMTDVNQRDCVHQMIEAVNTQPRINRLTESRVVDFSGISGDFTSTIEQADGSRLQVRHGVAILATGGRPGTQEKSKHSEHKRVVSQFDFDNIMASDAFSSSAPKCIVMIQCAGTRQEPRNYCSRICCLKSVNTAILLAEQYPDAKIYIFYRDMMTYGALEEQYTKARKKGVMFISYDPEKPPVLETEGEKPKVRGFDAVLNREILLEADWVSLARGIEPHPVSELAGLFGCTTTPDGFLREADAKWRPVDSGREGVFIAGLARAPARLEEALLDAEAAANRAYRIVSREQIIPQRLSPVLRKAYCTLCRVCIDICPYRARQMDPYKNQIIVDHAACQGCGACAAVCPNQATVIQGCEANGMLQAIEALL